LGAFLVGDAFGWCSGRVLFAGGSEVAVIDEPRLVEVVRTDGVASLERVLAAVVPRALARAEAAQASEGGGNPRFGSIFDEPDPAPSAPGEVASCLVVADRPGLASALSGALEARSVTCHHVEPADDFAGAARTLGAAAASAGSLDAVVLARSGTAPATGSPPGWERTLAEHGGIVAALHGDAAWARAVADYAAAARRPVRLVTLTDATTAGGRSRAQAAAQLARAAAGVTEGRVAAFAAGLEAPEAVVAGPTAALVAHLLTQADAAPLAGAELVVGRGWLGLRAHPRPLGSVTYGGPAVPGWLDATLREMVGAPAPAEAAP
ncbi:MAG TPA: hypothetical protein VMB72_07780, partial [Acidimicrobiales bacterium]|nr:hypothetical protein [Acidimicrobiales bacterium]